MKKLMLLFFAIVLTPSVMATSDSEEKPIQHLKLSDVTSMQEAEKVFFETTLEIKNKNKLDAAELHEIHMITYSLEKSIAYFAENLTGYRQELAQEMAIVVEDIHINSENNRQEEIKKYLGEYFELAKQLIISIF